MTASFLHPGFVLLQDSVFLLTLLCFSDEATCTPNEVNMLWSMGVLYKTVCCWYFFPKPLFPATSFSVQMASDSVYSHISLSVWESISLPLLVYTNPWQMLFCCFFPFSIDQLHNSPLPLLHSLMTQYIYHILSIISSLSLSAFLLVFSPSESCYHGVVF